MRQLTPLNRRCLFIQSKDDREQKCHVVVPAHPKIFDLPDSVLTDEGIAKDAFSVVRTQYEREAADYIRTFEAQGDPIDLSLKLDEYRNFNDTWSFDFSPYNGIIRLKWLIDGKSHEMGMINSPVIISNDARVKPGPMAKPEEWEMAPNIMLLYNTTKDPDFVLLPRETMLEYEHEFPGSKIVHTENDWMVEVTTKAFCSSYLDNVPQALLLRDWAVEYHNRLLKECYT